jgi:hypothetical protein
VDREIAEQYVPDDLAVIVCNQRQSSVALFPQRIHKRAFALLAECKPVHLANAIKVGGGFLSDKHQYFFR